MIIKKSRHLKIFFIIGIFVFFLFTSNSHSAENYLFNIGTANMGTQDADSAGNSEVKRTMAWTEVNGPVAFPWPGLVIMAGAKYHGQYLDYDNYSTRIINGATVTEDDLPRNLHAADVSLSIIKDLSPYTKSVIRFSPGIRSDLEDVSSEDMILNGMVLVRTKMGENTYGLGAAFTDTFGEQQTIPLVDIEWHATERLTIKGLLPIDIAAVWDVDTGLKAGFDANFNGYQYRLTEDYPWHESIIKYTELQIGAFIDFKITEMIHVIIRGGIVTAQELEFRDKNNRNKIIDEEDYETSGYGAVMIAIPFPSS